jgi:Arc/MetJ family transcription regulator
VYARESLVCILSGVKKRTNILLDTELVHSAATVLGTKTTTETVHAALRDSVRQARLRRLAERDLSGLTPDALAELRRPRGAAH